MSAKPYSILLLTDLRRNNARTIVDHVDAFGFYSRHEVYTYDPIGKTHSKHIDFNEFDVIVIHYSIPVINDYFLHPYFKERLAKFQGLKIQFIQDDYRDVNAYMEVMRAIGIHILFTLCPAARIPLLWPEDRVPGVKKFNTLAGYVPDYLVNSRIRPLEDRPLDVGYRSRDVPFWLGRLGQEKTLIVERFLKNAPAHGLKSDVSSREEDRLYGPLWTSFIRSCRAMLGTDSGASISDFDGTLQTKVTDYLRAHAGADFEEVHAAILHPFEGNVVVNCISPRAFETAALGTAMILFPGEYSGILRPWEHYIPLDKDFGNFTEVAAKIRDIDFLRGMTQRAHQHLIASENYSYRAFIRDFDEVVDAEASHVGLASKAAYRRDAAADLEPPKMREEVVRLLRRSAQGIQRRVAGVFKRSA